MSDDDEIRLQDGASIPGVLVALDLIRTPMALEVMDHLDHGGDITSLAERPEGGSVAAAVDRLATIGIVAEDPPGGGTASLVLTTGGRALLAGYRQIEESYRVLEAARRNGGGPGPKG